MARLAIQDWRIHRFTAAVPDLMEGLSMVAVDLHQFEDATELRGAAEGWRQAYDAINDVFDRTIGPTHGRGPAPPG